MATIDTAAINQTNQFNAQNAMALTVREYEGMWQNIEINAVYMIHQKIN